MIPNAHARDADSVTGEFLPIGGDWGLTNAAGVFSPDVRVQIRTTDGANIVVTANGYIQTSGVAHVHVSFETGSQDYYWLNYVVGISILTYFPSQGSATADVYQLL